MTYKSTFSSTFIKSDRSELLKASAPPTFQVNN